MPHPRLPIIQALRGFKADNAAWVTMIQQWPSADLEEGAALLDIVSLPVARYERRSIEIYQALEEKFGTALWNQEVNGQPWVQHAMSTWKGLALTESSDDLSYRCELVSFFMRGTEGAWRDQIRDQERWVPWAAHWLGRTETKKEREAVIEQVWSQGWVPLDAHVEGRRLAREFRHPAEVKGWLSGGGDATVTGLDPSRPDDPLWMIWHRNNPLLRDVILHRVPEASALNQEVNPERMKRLRQALLTLRGKGGRVRAQTWWETLTSDPDWMTFRMPDTQTPMWLNALSACAPLLPYLCKAAQENPRVREHLNDTNALGLGLWHVLLGHHDSRSLTTPLLEKLAQWVPPTSPGLWVGSDAYGEQSTIDTRTSIQWGLRSWQESTLASVLPRASLVGSDDQQRQWLAQWYQPSMRPAWENLSMMGDPGHALIPELARAHELILLGGCISAAKGAKEDKLGPLRQAVDRFREHMDQPLPPQYEVWLHSWRKRLDNPTTSYSWSGTAKGLAEEALRLVETRARQLRGLAQSPQPTSEPRRHRQRA